GSEWSFFHRLVAKYLFPLLADLLPGQGFASPASSAVSKACRGAANGLVMATLYQEHLARRGFVASMSRKGNAYDNAVVESFFGNLKNDLVHHRSFATREEARAEIFDYMELFYNRRRAHATLQYMSPVDYEDSHRVTESNCPENPG